VSCTVCHQVRADNLGADASFSGGMVFDTRKPFGGRELYGSFAAGELAAAMAASSGYLPVQGVHIKDSELCATCHTLFTPYVTADGTFSETLFPEQTPYIEWLNSEFATRQSCQDCHMPPAQGEVLTSSIANAKRSPVGRHEFVGGNAVLLEILKSNAAELQPTADETHFEATISLTHNLLQTQTATLQVLPATVEDGKLTFDVLVTSQVGHKFPSSYPSRRAWLHVVVTDASGKVLFESGLLEADGSIRGNANDAEASQFEPHYDLITAADQVQIYEPILSTDEGEVTTNLLKAATYLKDNRLLPAGFDKTAAPPEVGVSGDALTDANFLGGSDQVTYQVALDGATEGWKIVAELWYAPIGYRWARNLTEESSPEAVDFARFLQGAPYTALLVASAEASGK
jgi:hypothetical protein